MATATANTTVTPHTFAAGSALGQWKFRLLQNGTQVQSVVSGTPNASFPNVAPGTYKIDAARLMADNSLAQAPVPSSDFTIAAPAPVVGDIVETVTVTVSA